MLGLDGLKNEGVRVLFKGLIMIIFLVIYKLVKSGLIVGEKARSYLSLIGVETEDCDNSNHAEDEENTKGTGRPLIINSDYLLIQIRV